MAWLFANWKAQSDLQMMLDLVQLVEEGSEHVVLCPPFSYLWPISKVLPLGCQLGAQDVSAFEKGAYTGEVTASMLQEMSAQYVLIGHSERRSHFSESQALLDQKLKCALSQNLTPVICVGLQEDSSSDAAIAQMVDQIPDLSDAYRVFLAYEPVFAIGTGKVAGASHIEIVLKKLAQVLASRYPNLEMSFLYGGSVNGNNIEAILAIEGCDGVLVGSASLKINQWGQLLEKCKTFS